ncbi:MAG: ABC transporter ATP-binding protein/permease [Alphaproteobacteria bacterium]|nr:ABC transporter ATP-binding protein/permease [Alphaproteobacteria bacterium]
MNPSRFTFLSQVWTHLIRPYWTSSDRWIALALLGGHLVFMGAYIALTVRFNYWHNDVFTALQELNGKVFFNLLGIFSILAFFSISVFITKFYFLQVLEIRWRKWMVHHHLDCWMKDRRYYALQLKGNGSDNPDQRIAEDTHQFIDKTLSLTLGVFQQAITLLSFLGILWSLSGTLHIPLGSYTLSIPGYMCWGAILYAICGSFFSYYLGRPLIRLSYEYEKREADFRYSLVRFRENMEPIALYEGEAQEKQIFSSRVNQIIENSYMILKRMMTINVWNNFYNQVNGVFPLLLAAPRLFAKELTFGGLMQILDAFRHVSHALAFFVDNYPSIASWRATTNRLLEFKQSLEGFSPSPLTHTTHDKEEVHVVCETISLPHGAILNENINLIFRKGEHTIITGPTGIGKSTLARVIAGLWTYGKGEIRLPSSSFLFLPQKPYMPLGSLKAALNYPGSGGSVKETEDVLVAVGLAPFIDRLEEVNDWARVLSLGEQQRIAIARTLLAKPQWLFLDEATSAMGEASEAQLYRALKAALPDTTLISVGHRESLKPLHDREIRLESGSSYWEAAVA